MKTFQRWWLTMAPVCAKPVSLEMMLHVPCFLPSSAVLVTRYVSPRWTICYTNRSIVWPNPDQFSSDSHWVAYVEGVSFRIKPNPTWAFFSDQTYGNDITTVVQDMQMLSVFLFYRFFSMNKDLFLCFIIYFHAAKCAIFLPRDALVHSAVLTSHVVLCLSVCLSVTLVDQDHIGWKSWKLISWK